MGSGGRSVLVAEDDLAQREVLSELLTQEGYEVRLACSSAEAIAQLTPPLDIILMDVAGVFSPLFMQAFQGLAQRPRLLLVSGNDALAEMAKSWGADAWLNKPYDLGELLKSLERLSLSDAREEVLVSAPSAQV